ncbi:MurR/RpiR family transcriptional regulator [Mesoplasma florum]|uniref:MurR/RpiR family transcriptional regulator n=1 Tax=Mesoplasma florum TaxID=2151 RepID=UPI000BE3F3DF|nr:MurR/RpiR family transcriptional regulator [Mesoplasma florum]ATI74343.1 hypothetical protein CQZ70_02310 [Mesoplasma florum]
MFQSIKEKLTVTYNNNESNTHKLIAKYLLDCLEENKTPTSKECSEVCFISESALTSFSKKYGYNGFREIAIRIKVEREYYKDFEKQKLSAKPSTLFNQVVQNIKQIDLQEDEISLLVSLLKECGRTFLFSSYEQNFNVEIFASQLQYKGIDSNFNSQRKMNPIWIDYCKEDDLCIFFAFGLDNQYLVNYYNLVKNKTKNIVIVTSSSQSHKFQEFKAEILIYEHNREDIYLSMRSVVLNYLFTKVIIKL